MLGGRKYKEDRSTTNFLEHLPLPDPNKKSKGECRQRFDFALKLHESEIMRETTGHGIKQAQDKAKNEQTSFVELFTRVVPSTSTTCSDFAGFPSREEETPCRSTSRVFFSKKVELGRRNGQASNINNGLSIDGKKRKLIQIAPEDGEEFQKNRTIDLPNVSEMLGMPPGTANAQEQLSRQKFQTVYSNNNKYSTETTSEFPLSSPRTSKSYRGKYTQRQIGLKNSLPANSFGRKLAFLTSSNPQMTFEEKLSAWNCETELSDVEDVNNFDDMFRHYEDYKRQLRHVKTNDSPTPKSKESTNVSKCYSFAAFKSNLLKSMDAINRERNNTNEHRIESSVVFNKNPQRPMHNSLFHLNSKQANHTMEKFMGDYTTSTGTSAGGNALNGCRNANVKRNFIVTKNGNNLIKKAELSSSDETNPNLSKFHELNPMPTNEKFDEHTKLFSSLPALRSLGRAADVDTPVEGLIKCRLDYDNSNKGNILREKKNELFGNCTNNNSSKFIATPATAVRHFKTNGGTVMAGEARNVYESKTSDANEKGAFHQQHEFCNYLGLTGMSTANAVANAVAELAQCNLTRRSLRVHRIQQLEKKAKSLCEKRDESCTSLPQDCPQEIEQPNQNDRSSCVPAALGNDVKNSEIKIICQISAPCKEDAEKISKNCAYKISKSIKKDASSTGMLMRKISHSQNSMNKSKLSSEHSISSGSRHKLSSGNMRISRSRNRRPSHALDEPKCKIAIKSIVASCSETNGSVMLNRNNLIYEKIQRCLQESRKIRPKVFIVSTLNNNNNTAEQPKPNTMPQKAEAEGSCLSKKTAPNDSKNVSTRAAKETLASSSRNRKGHKVPLERKLGQKRLFQILKKSLLNLYRRKNTKTRTFVMLRGASKKKSVKHNRNSVDKSVYSVFKSYNAIQRLQKKTVNRDSLNGQKKEKTSQKSANTIKQSAPSQEAVEEVVGEEEHEVVNDNSHDDAACHTVNSVEDVHTEKKSEMSIVDLPDICTTQDNSTQTVSIHYLMKPNCSRFQNPLKRDNGRVLFIYYESNVLLVVQDSCVSFWKYSRPFSVLACAMQQHIESDNLNANSNGNTHANIQTNTNTNTHTNANKITFDWIFLGECKRLSNDTEIDMPYSNRLCMNNAMPMYIEMRCREVPRDKRECHLLFLYINAYNYVEDELQARMFSIHLDAVQSPPTNIVYTSIPNTRYFMLAWPQENILHKPKSGLCKYALTPYLDTLASIREFKNLRHEIRQLNCIDDDKLLGIGRTQITIWDHRSGDVIMNFDASMELGRNLGSMFYPSLELNEGHLLLLYQYLKCENEPPELILVGFNVSHTAPSFRVIRRCNLPVPAFDELSEAIQTDQHLILRSLNDDEMWVNCTDPAMITCVPSQNTCHFYNRGKSHVIVVDRKHKTLTVDSFANHILKLAATNIL